MTVSLSPVPFQFLPNPNNTGSPALFFRLFTYIAGTSTKQNTWIDSTQTVVNSNPLTLDANGFIAASSGSGLWLDPTLSYKIVWALPGVDDPPTSPVRTMDNVRGPLDLATLTQALIGSVLYPQTVAESAAAVTPTNYGYPPLNPFRYGADGTGGSADTTAYNAVNSVLAKINGIAGWKNGLSIPGWEKTSQEIAATVTPQQYEYSADGIATLNVFRFFTAAQIADVLAGTQTQDVSSAIQAANDFLEGRAIGSIATFTTLVGGSGYGSGSYTFVPLTGGHGAIASANITVAGGVVTVCTVGNPGNGYQVGDVLSASNTNLGGSGSGFSITVATLQTGGKTTLPGGTLFFPGGRYYCNLTGLRIGDMVQWVGNQFSTARLAWSNSFSGNAVTLGPDQSGFNSRGGYYEMGAVLDNLQLELGNNTAWGIYTTGAQQNSSIRNLWVTNVNQSGGIFLQDHKGSVGFAIENVYIIGGNNQTATCVGIHSDLQACVSIKRVSMNGGGGGQANPNFIRGIEIVSGGHLIQDFECEITVTAIDIAAATGEFPQTIDHVDVSGVVTQAIWIHSGFTGDITARSINVGTGIIPIKNDNTNEGNASGAGGAVVPFYSWSGTAADVSSAQNLVAVPPLLNPTFSSPITIDVSRGGTFRITATSNSAFTVGAPTMGANAMPTNGRIGQRILIQIRNTSGGALGAVTWDPIYKMTAWTSPATGNSRSVEFQWDSAHWVQLWQSTVDVPN